MTYLLLLVTNGMYANINNKQNMKKFMKWFIVQLNFILFHIAMYYCKYVDKDL